MRLDGGGHVEIVARRPAAACRTLPARKVSGLPEPSARCSAADRNALSAVLLANYTAADGARPTVEPLGFRMTRNEWEGGHSHEFSFERRAANEALDHPRRRHRE